MKHLYTSIRIVFISIFFFAFTTVHAQVIFTVAGNGNYGTSGDGHPADSASFSSPYSVAIDKSGNIYVADNGFNAIREVNKTTGTITTIAGGAATGMFGGDGGPAVSAYLNGPKGVAVDDSGNVYIADYGNNAIRKITKATGIINTIAGGNSTGGYGGNGVTANNSVVSLNGPSGIAIDKSGNIYFCDQNNYIVRKITKATDIITTVAGIPQNSGFIGNNASATTLSFSTPEGIAVDKMGNIYIADAGLYCIWKVTASNDTMAVFAGTTVTDSMNTPPSLATYVSLQGPNGVAVDTVGNVYISDQYNNSIDKVNIHDTLSIIAGLGSDVAGFNGDHIMANLAETYYPAFISVDDSGSVYFADQNNYRAREIRFKGPNIITQPPLTINGCFGYHATIGLTASGPGITYQWMVDSSGTGWKNLSNSANYSGVNTDSLHITMVSKTSNGLVFKCNINSGYVVSDSCTLVPLYPPSINFGTPNDSVCPGSYNTLYLYVDGTVNSYLWSNDSTTSYINVFPAVTTTYSVAISVPGCVIDTSIQLLVNKHTLKANALPNTQVCRGTSITLYGTGGTNYNWSNGSANPYTFNADTSVTYYLSGNDMSGCADSSLIKITVVNPPKVTATVSKDSICPGGIVTLNGSGAVVYTWSNGVSNNVPFSPSASEVYYLTGTDANGCIGHASIPVIVNALPVITGSAIPSAVCAGSSVTLSGNGGASYSWSNGVSNGKPFVPTSSGTYTVTGTGANGCMNTGSVSVTVDPLPVISATAFPSATLCQGSSLALFGSGGASYAWSGGVNNGVSFTPSSTVTYTVSGIDANGCINKDSIKITVHKKVVPTITSTNTSCGLNNGMASVAASNGIPPYSYTWSTTPAKSTASVDSLAAGTYVVSVSDSANCASTVAVSISSSTAPILTVSTTNSNCGSIGTGSASVLVNGGTAPYHYMWNNGDTLASDYNLKAATYIITVTDINGCSTFAPAIVTNANGPKINTLSTVNVKCYGDATGSININVTGGTAPYQYSWSNGATTASISSLYSGPYQLTVTDADSCTSVETFTIGQPHAPMAATTSSVKADCGVADGSASVAVTGGSSPYTYAWNNASTTGSNANIMAGVYSVIITDNNGCKDSVHVSVSDKTGPSLVMSLSGNATCGSGGLLSVTASGPNAPFTYAWSNGASTTSISNVPAGNYNVTVTDSKGCTSSADTTVSELTPPGISLCMVTVDPLSNKHNIIIWDKSNTPKIASYNIYKESTAAGVYFKIASVPYKVLGTYVDSLSDPTVRSWRYKISQVDSCGNESPLSANHKTMHLTVNQGLGNNINLIWDNYEGLNFSTYYVYRDTIATNFTLIDSIPNNIFTYTDNNPLHTKAPLLYRIGISNPGGCTPAIEAINYNASKSNTGALVFNPSLGIKTINVFNSLQIFPNPSTGKVTFSIDLPEGSQDLSLTVLNTLGQELMTADYSRVSGSFSKEVDLSNLAKGVYFFKLKTNSNTTYRKVVIQ